MGAVKKPKELLCGQKGENFGATAICIVRISAVQFLELQKIVSFHVGSEN